MTRIRPFFGEQTAAAAARPRAGARAKAGSRLDARELGLRTLHLAVLSSFAIAQPLFDLLGKNAAFFAIRGSSGRQILFVTFAVLLAPPAALALVEAFGTLVHRALGRALHLSFVALLLSLLALELLARTALNAWAAVAAALVAGAGAAAIYRFAAPARSALTILAPAPLVFVALFLLGSPVSKLVLPGAEAATLRPIAATSPVVFVVFDEFSGTSLMNASRQIDAVRFPNFAALARDGTWYRNATTVAPFTEKAVPAILTGKIPKRGQLPIFRDHPDNVFTLFGRSYALDVHEPETSLCPRQLCRSGGARVVPPDLNVLVSDLEIVYMRVLLPDALARHFPSIEGRWGNFAAEEGAGPARIRGREALQNPEAVFDAFLRSIKAGRRPTLHFVHVNLPHIPWQYYPSGTHYLARFEGLAAPGLEKDVWTDRWSALQGQERYLLQVGFVDRLLGRLVVRLRATRQYDRSLIVVTADHGVSFVAGQPRRALTSANAQNIAFTPLFIKRPHEARGKIVDRWVRSVDIVPTIAAALGVRLPWETDGRPAARGRTRPRPPPASIEVGGLRLDTRGLEARRWRGLSEQVAAFGAGEPWERAIAIGPYRALVGQRVEAFAQNTVGRAAAQIDDASLFGSVEPAGPLVPGYVTGRVTGRGARTRAPLAIAVNGRIAAVTETYGDGGAVRFAAVAGQGAFRPGANAVRVFAISRAEARVRLALLGGTARESTYELVDRPGRAPRITAPRGREISVVADVVRGDYDFVGPATGQVRFAGWAGDVIDRRARDLVLVFANGRLVYSTTAAVRRPDLGPGLLKAGFDFSLPVQLLLGGERRVEVRVFAVIGNTASEINCPRPRPLPPGYDPRVRKRAVALLAGATLLLPVGCGSGSASPRSLPGPSQQLLSQADVERYDVGTPERALVDWWRNSQFANLPAFLDAFTASFRKQLVASPKTGRALDYFSGAIRTARPSVRGVSRNGDRATVYTEITYRQPVGATRYITSTLPRAFTFARDDGQWKLVDDLYVQSSIPTSLRRRFVRPSG